MNRADYSRRDVDEFYEDEVKVTKSCMICGKKSTVAFPGEYYRNGMKMRAQGALIQDAFPISTPEVREFLLTGMCPECQAMFFCDDEFEEVEFDEDEEFEEEPPQFLDRELAW